MSEEGRRSFLRIFGLTGAAFATTAVDGTSIEIERDPDAVSIAERLKKQAIPHSSLIPNYLDVQKGRLYSAFEIYPDPATEQTRIICFSYGVGNAVPWKTGYADYADTNMQKAQELCAPESFAVERVGIVFSPICDPEDRSRFIDSSSVNVWIGMKNYFRRPTSECFGTGEPVLKERFPEFPTAGMVDLSPLPLALFCQQSFHGEIETRPANYKSKIRGWLVYDGLHARGVQ